MNPSPIVQRQIVFQIPRRRRMYAFPTLQVALMLLVLGYGSITGQDTASTTPKLSLDEFRPRSMLKVHQTDIQRAKFPVIDVHSHFGYRLKGSSEKLDEFVRLMDRNNIAMCVSLDARLGDTLDEHQKYLWDKYPSRFAIFVHLDWQGDGKSDQPETWDCHRPDFARRVAQQLKEAKQQGACGLKFFKRFGLAYRNPDGTLLKIDDPRWNPIWRACGDLKLPVIIHTADPAAFFLPIDKTNERWEELSRHPDWSFPSDKFPSRESLLQARNRVIARHPRTQFIGAHGANNSEDLATVSKWLDQYPNLHVEFASRIGELGRQPYTARKFLIQYADRVIFGTDGPWPEQRLKQYWRFFETYDEYFPYSEKEFPPQGFWNIYGVGLPESVLRKIYHQNLLRLIPSLQAKFTEVTKP